MAVVSTIEPPTVNALAGPGGSAPGQSSIDLPAAPLQQPSASQAQEFARAVAIPPDVQIAQPAGDGGLIERFAHQADARNRRCRAGVPCCLVRVAT